MYLQTEFSKTDNNNVGKSDLGKAGPEDAEGHLFRDLDLISRFCHPICSRDNEIREVALEVITKTVEGWLDGAGSPRRRFQSKEKRKEPPNSSWKGCACSEIVGKPIEAVPQEYMDLVAFHLPIILRLSLNCPFANVREKCQHILEVVQVSFLL